MNRVLASLFRDWPLIILLIAALWLELAFSLSGLLFATCVLAYSWSGRGNEHVVFTVSFFIVALWADVVFGRVMGETAIVLSAALLIWRAVQNLSRWRLLAYLALGSGSVYLLDQHARWPLPFIALLAMWALIRLMHAQRGGHEIHIR
jgi:uncharacterized membrane protein YccC